MRIKKNCKKVLLSAAVLAMTALSMIVVASQKAFAAEYVGTVEVVATGTTANVDGGNNLILSSQQITNDGYYYYYYRAQGGKATVTVTVDNTTKEITGALDANGQPNFISTNSGTVVFGMNVPSSSYFWEGAPYGWHGMSPTEFHNFRISYWAEKYRTPIPYGISYNLNGGSVAGNRTDYNCETNTFTLNNPTRAGYTFTGWTGSNGSTPQTSVTIGRGSIGNRTYTANWTPVNYSITYNLNGGSVTGNPTSYNITSNTFTLKNPTRTGYTFTGWTGSNGSTPSKSVSVAKGSTGSKSYTANWTPANYSITYNLNGGSVTGNPTSYNITSNTFTLKNPTRTGYTFTGWTGSNGKTASKSVSVAKGSTGNKTYTANWTPVNYSISYNLNGGSVTGNPTSYTIRTLAFTLNSPTKTGYTFEGWTGSNGSKPNRTVVIGQGSTGNKSYTANWTVNKYAVTYIDVVKDTNEELGRKSINKDYGTKVAGSDLGTDTTVHKYYKNYRYDSCSYATVDTSGATVYRYFVLGLADYKVIHQQEQLDGSYVTTDTETFKNIIGSDVTPNTFTYTGFTSPELQTVTISGDGSTKVVYQYSLNSYKIAYDLNGGSVTGNPTTVRYNETFSLKAPTKSGKKFLGWSVSGMDYTKHEIDGNITSDNFIDYTDLNSSATFKNLSSINGATVTFTAVWDGEHYNSPDDSGFNGSGEVISNAFSWNLVGVNADEEQQRLIEEANNAEATQVMTIFNTND